MPKKTVWVKASGLLFLLGIIIAIIAGIFSKFIDPNVVRGMLVVLGFIIGLLGAAGVGNIDRSDTQIFLLAVIALVAAQISGKGFEKIGENTSFVFVGGILSTIVDYIGYFVVPAAIIIALLAIWKAGSTKF